MLRPRVGPAAGAVAVLVALISAGAGLAEKITGCDGIVVDVDARSGQWRLWSPRRVAWEGGAPIYRRDGAWRRLELASMANHDGVDALGGYSELGLQWAEADDASRGATTTIRAYHDSPAVLFDLLLHGELNGTAVEGAHGGGGGGAAEFVEQPLDIGVATVFPEFRVEADARARRGWLTWTGNQACPKGRRHCTPMGEWGLDHIPGGVAGGLPLVVFGGADLGHEAVVISPAATFMATSSHHASDARGGRLQVGATGSIEALPAGFTTSTAMVFGTGVNGAAAAWGRALRRLHGTEHPHAGDVAARKLSYWTDNGAYYYYNTVGGTSYEETVALLRGYFARASLPVATLQLDSWWYYKEGDTNGVTDWVARPDVFADGVRGAQQRVGLPLTLHNRYFDPGNAYEEQYDFANSFYAVPRDPAFFRDLFANATRDGWGLAVYEQDWLHNTVLGVRQLRTEAALARTWLMHMDAGARAAGIRLQFCMSYPRFFLQSLEISSLTQIRVSDDYGFTPLGTFSQWSIGDTSMLAAALDLSPFKDVFLTGTHEPGDHYHIHTEVAPEFQAAVAALSRGPVAFGDRIGWENATIIRATCTSDGTLLQPSAPATTLDGIFLARGLGADTPGAVQGLITAAPTILANSHRFTSVLAAEVYETTTLAPADVGAEGGRAPLFAFRHRLVDGFPALARFDAAHPIVLAPGGRTDYRLFHVAPQLLPSNYVLLGELSKLVPFSPTRISGVRASSADAILTLAGAPAEVVTLAYVNVDDPTAVSTVSCTLSAAGTATASLRAGSCVQW